jgi:Lon protease-like protein
MEIPIFPLPNVVFFPHTLLPLHVFEPRYRQMLADCLAGERRLAVVLLKPGWEADYEGRPPVHTVAGAGEIARSKRRPDGRSDILLRGLGRIMIEEELPSPKPYRVARASWLDEVYPPRREEALESHTERLRQMCAQLLSTLPQPVPRLVELLTDHDRPGTFVDRVTDLVVHDIEQRQRLLEENDVERRVTEAIGIVEELLRRMERGTPGTRARWN